MVQNTSHAVVAQRISGNEGLDDFPTPPWAVRAFLEHVLSPIAPLSCETCLEPACGRGYMARALAEYFAKVDMADVYPYSENIPQFDFLVYEDARIYDWVVTNPPFKDAERFIKRARGMASHGVAMLTRTSFLESKGRYERLFKDNPPDVVAQYVERVPMVKGRLDRKASTATSYAWIVWDYHSHVTGTKLVWIPPSRHVFEKDSDYI